MLVYCFSIDNRVNWSAETPETLKNHPEAVKEMEYITEFLENSEPGEFYRLSNGDLIVRSSYAIGPY